MEMGCKVPAPVFWSQMTVYLLLLVLLSLLKNICGQVRQLQLGFDAESPRSDFTHERSSQGIDRVEFWGQNDSARHPSKLARNSLETRCPQNSRVVNELLRVICVYTFLVWVLPCNHHCTVLVCEAIHEGMLHAQYWYVRLYMYMKGYCIRSIGTCMWGYIWRGTAYTVLVCEAIHEGVLHAQYWYVRLYMKGCCMHSIGMWGYTWRGAACTVLVCEAIHEGVLHAQYCM